MSRFTRVCLLAGTMFSAFNVIGSVVIHPQYSEVKSPCGTEREITLPCNYSSSNNENIQIEWYRVRHNGKDRVMRVNTNGNVVIAENFRERVSRGEGASLILRDPTSEDSGTYTCDVTITKDVPCCATGFANLTIGDGACGVTRGVVINPKFSEVKPPCGTVSEITLPCSYSSSNSENIQIEWYRVRQNDREKVMRVNTDGEVIVAKNFSGRVSRGADASLVMTGPTSDDSGTYTCEVVITEDIPCCATGFVNLTIGDAGCAEKGKAFPVLFCILDILGIMTGIGFIVVMRFKQTYPWSEISGRIIAVANVCATTLCLLAVVLLGVHIGSPHPDNFIVPGILFSVIGIAIICGCALVYKTSFFKQPICRCPEIPIPDRLKFCRKSERSGQQNSHKEEERSSGAQETTPLTDVETANVETASNENGTSDSKEIGQPPEPNIGVSKIKELSDIYRFNCKKKTLGSFVTTSLCQEATDALDGANAVLLIGGSAEGKSSILRFLAANTSYLPVECSTVAEVDKYMNEKKSDENLMFVCDDPLGKSSMEHHRIGEWVNMGERADAYLKSNKFIFATRSLVWMDSKLHLQDSPYFSKTVEVTSAKLTVEDKRRLVWKYLAGSRNLNANEVDKIARIKKPIAFSHCCSLMSDAVQKDQKGAELLQIFGKPLPLVSSEIEKLVNEDELKYAVLCLVMLCGGRLNCRELAVDSLSNVTADLNKNIERSGCSPHSLKQLKECADKLVETYLDKKIVHHGFEKYEVYEFSHDVIQQAVTVSYGNRNFPHCLQYVDLHVIVAIVRPQSYERGEHEFALNVPEAHYPVLVELFTRECVDGNRKAVFENVCVKDEQLQDTWCEYLKDSDYMPKTFGPRKSPRDKCMLHYARSSNADILLNFLVENYGVKCKCLKVKGDEKKSS